MWANGAWTVKPKPPTEQELQSITLLAEGITSDCENDNDF